MKNDLLYSKSASLIGSTLFNIILNLWILDTFNSVKMLGFILSVSSISAFFFSFIGGYLADSKYVLTIVKFVDLLSFILCLGSLLLIENISYTIIYGLVFLLNMNVSLTAPLIKKLVSDSIEKNNIIEFNSKIAIVSELVKIIVPVISTYLYQKEIVTLNSALLINSFSFFISYIFIRKVKIINVNSVKKITGYIETLVYIRKYKLIMLLLITGAGSNFFLAGFNLFLPVFSVDILKNSAFYGLFLSLESIGAFLGTLSTKIIKLDKYIIKERLGIMVAGLLMFLLLVWQNFLVVAFICFILNFFYVRYNIAFQSFIQTDVKSNYIGKVFSLSYILSNLALPFGSSLFGIIFSDEMFIGIFIVALGLTAINLLWIIFSKNEVVNNK